MSGGVDSSVAAYLLKKQGYDVVGIFMRCWGDGPAVLAGVNCAEKDAEDARRVTEHIGIPFYVWDFEEEYKRAVVDYMVEGYRKGLTPNPDVMCNREIKFGIFLKKALSMGADYVATGHYVRLKQTYLTKRRGLTPQRGVRHLALGLVRPASGAPCPLNLRGTFLRDRFVSSLCVAKDKNKDQSYFLWTLTQKELAHCLFPIGDYVKPEVRRIAKRAGLPTAEKKDSQGICFLGQVSIQDFLKEYLPERRGAVLTVSGEKIGEHNGAHFYTIGQRRGIGALKHGKGVSDHEPLYVAKKDVRKNIVVMAKGDDVLLTRKEITLTNVNLINPASLKGKLPVFARVRYRQPLSPATLTMKKSGAVLSFAKPQKFIAEGQSAVFYSKDGRVLGGGIIV